MPPKGPDDPPEPAPLMLTDIPWSELEKLPREVAMSGAYRLPTPSPERLDLAVGRRRRQSSLAPSLHQMLPAADPKLVGRFLTPNAPAVSPERQQPATLGDTKKKSLGKSAFDNDRDSFFVKLGENRHAMVLGWNHAALLLRTPTGYVVHRLYCYASEGHGHKAFGLIDDLKELPASGDPIVDPVRGTWRVVKPPPLTLERLVTYGVSSCSFAVLFSLPDADVIAVSHMSGKPPIPVGLMMEDFLEEEDEAQLVVSHLPQSNELKKFDHDVLFGSRVRCQTLLMSRGKLPNRDEGDTLFPQMGHADMGLVFPRGATPRIVGVLGVGSDQDYWTLLPLAVSNRLRAAVFPEGMENNLLFSLGQDNANLLGGGLATPGLCKLFAERGHVLVSPTVVTVVKRGQSWLITSRSDDLNKREYRVVLDGTSLRVSCAQEPMALCSDIVQPLLDGQFGFPLIHREMYQALCQHLQIFAPSYKPRSKGFFASPDAIDVYLSALVKDFLESRNQQRAFARLIGGLPLYDLQTHPFAQDAAAVMKKNRYAVNIPLQKIDRL